MVRALLVAAVSCLLAGPAGAQPSSSSGSLLVVSVDGGTLKIGRKKAVPGTFLRDGDKLTLSGGKAVIKVGTQGAVMLKGETEAVAEAGDRRGFSLLKGAILSALPRLHGAFEVRTPAVVAAVRGTEFYVEAVDKQHAYICLCEGSIAVSPTGVTKFSTRREEGKPLEGVLRLAGDHPHTAWTFTRRGSALEQKDDAMRGHDDAELSVLRDER